MPFPVRRTLSARLLAPLRDSKTVASCHFSSFYIYSIYCGKISLFYTTYTERVRSLLCTVISLVFAVAKAYRVKAPLSQTRACGNSIYHKREFKIAFPFPLSGERVYSFGLSSSGFFASSGCAEGVGTGALAFALTATGSSFFASFLTPPMMSGRKTSRMKMAPSTRVM